MVGTTISHYKVLEKIGKGGMGEVYRATDTKLNRDVALKILPQQFASDSQRMGRFQREAEVLASLDHPNIGQIYGIEDAGQTKALRHHTRRPTIPDGLPCGSDGFCYRNRRRANQHRRERVRGTEGTGAGAMIGNTLSHHKIVEKLGQGGMGEVYLPEDSRLGRNVAAQITQGKI